MNSHKNGLKRLLDDVVEGRIENQRLLDGVNTAVEESQSCVDRPQDRAGFEQRASDVHGTSGGYSPVCLQLGTGGVTASVRGLEGRQ